MVEIKEEMRALYSPEEINLIISCLTGFRAVFTIDDLKWHIKRYYNNSILATKIKLVARN